MMCLYPLIAIWEMCDITIRYIRAKRRGDGIIPLQIILAALIVFALATMLPAAEPGITVSWTFASTNMDGTPITDLAGAKVYYGTSSSNYTHVIDVPGGSPGQTVTQHIEAAEHDLTPGVVYYLNGTAYNTSGLESDFCDEVARSFQIADMPRIRIEETVQHQIWRRVYEVIDGVYRQRWETITEEE